MRKLLVEALNKFFITTEAPGKKIPPFYQDDTIKTVSLLIALLEELWIVLRGKIPGPMTAHLLTLKSPSANVAKAFAAQQ